MKINKFTESSKLFHRSRGFKHLVPSMHTLNISTRIKSCLAGLAMAVVASVVVVTSMSAPSQALLEDSASEGLNYPIAAQDVALTETLWSMSYNGDAAPQLEITYPTAQDLGELSLS